MNEFYIQQTCIVPFLIFMSHVFEVIFKGTPCSEGLLLVSEQNLNFQW